MIQINIGDHNSIVPYYHMIPSNVLWQFRWARQQAFWIAANKPGANPYFQSLPGGRSLSDLLADGSIWVNYSDGSEVSTPGAFGETNAVGGSEITITSVSTAIGQWTTLATLIHELAHVDGAPADGPLAEGALIPCGLGFPSEQTSNTDDPFTPYQPGING